MDLIDLTNISKYRTELMGYAILGVMIAHIKTINGYTGDFLLSLFCYSVFTGGFVFLSGLGLYSSLAHDFNIEKFYIKRFKRLLIPFWVLSIPYFLYIDIIEYNSVLDFFFHITTLAFWISGNYSGMWYISLMVIMYLLYPLLHRWLYLDNCLKKKRLFVASLLSITIPVFIKISFPSYYALIDVGVQKIPLLILGSATMFVISRKSSSYAELLIVVLCILMFSFVERSAFYMIVKKLF